MVFGWATVTLFGRVPQERQIFLSVVAFGSIIWLVAVVGIAFPSAATMMLAFVPVPKWVEEVGSGSRYWRRPSWFRPWLGNPLSGP